MSKIYFFFIIFLTLPNLTYPNEPVKRSFFEYDNLLEAIKGIENEDNNLKKVPEKENKEVKKSSYIPRTEKEKNEFQKILIALKGLKESFNEELEKKESSFTKLNSEKIKIEKDFNGQKNELTKLSEDYQTLNERFKEQTNSLKIFQSNEKKTTQQIKELKKQVGILLNNPPKPRILTLLFAVSLFTLGGLYFYFKKTKNQNKMFLKEIQFLKGQVEIREGRINELKNQIKDLDAIKEKLEYARLEAYKEALKEFKEKGIKEHTQSEDQKQINLKKFLNHFSDEISTKISKNLESILKTYLLTPLQIKAIQDDLKSQSDIDNYNIVKKLNEEIKKELNLKDSSIPLYLMDFSAAETDKTLNT